MANDPNVIDPTTLEQTADATDQLTESTKRATDQYRQLSLELNDLERRLSTLQRTQQGNSKEAKNLGQDIENVKKQMDDLRPSVSAAVVAMEGARQVSEEISRNFGGTNTASMDLHRSMGELTKSLLGAGAAGALLGSNVGRALLQPFSNAVDVVKAMSPTLGTLNEVFHAHAAAQNMVNVGYLGLGKSMDEFKGRGTLVIDAVQKTAAQFFFTGQEQQKFIETTRAVPGALDSVTTSATNVGKNMTQMAQYMLIARGAGIEMGKAAEILSKSYLNFGEGAMPKVAEAFVKFKAAAAAGGTSVEVASKAIEEASAPLAIFGTKIAEASNVWLTFKNALKDVPVAQVGQMTQAISTGIAGMNLNAQAFVAQMSGMSRGAGALAGALRMELEMRQPGGMERNLERVQKAISSLTGGRILTLQEATDNPALAMQFQMQRQMVQQTLGVSAAPQQSRILEVLQNVEKGGITTAAANKNMQDLMADGQKAQSASTTAMEKTAMGVGRTVNILTSLTNIESAAGDKLAEIGKALGARGVGTRTRQADVMRAARAVPAAGRAAASTASRELLQIGREVATMSAGIRDAFRAESRQRFQMARRAIGKEPPIEVDRPARPGTEMQITPLPTATGLPFAPRGASATMLPIFRRQPEPEMPMAPTAGRTESAGGRTRGRRQMSDIETEAYVAEPLIPESITVKVVCEQCGHKLGQQIENLSRENRGG